MPKTKRKKEKVKLHETKASSARGKCSMTQKRHN
jgi:hypothetical protein